MTDENYQGGEIVPIEIDLTVGRNGQQVSEIFFHMFGAAVQSLLKSMFGGTTLPVKIKGSKAEISAFAKTIGRDKKYMKSAAKYGLNDPRVLKDKYKLRKAASKFQRATGIKYPFSE